MSDNNNSRRSFLDELDVQLISALQEGIGRPPLGKLAEQMGISKAKLHYRLKRLEDEGIVKGYKAVIDPAKLGLDQQIIVRIRAKFGPGYHEKVGKLLMDIPGVYAVYFVFGENDFVILARSHDREEIFQKMQILFNSNVIERTTTEIVTKVIKEDFGVSLDQLHLK